MGNNDRSVELLELAARAQTSTPNRRARSDCRNPECVNGLTPGLVARGGGTKGAPLFGAGGVGAKKLMHWSWVSCLACNRSDDQRKAGAQYRDLGLSDTQIAQRAQQANSKASYNPQEPRPTLSRAAGSPAFTAPVPGVDAAKLNEMIEQNKQLNERIAEMVKQNVAMTDTLSRMSMQITSLLEDNAKMRLELAKPTVSLEYAKTRAQAADESLRSVLSADKST
jgi:hypothetical protein